MKLSMFRLRKNTDNSSVQQAQDSRATPREPLKTQEEMQESLKTTQENMGKLMSMFQSFLKLSVQQQAVPKSIAHHSETYTKTQLNYENRDRHVILPIPATIDLKHTTLERWFTEVAIAAFSSSFNFYLTQQMNFEQAKVFCSETILANLLRYTQQHPLTEQHMALINDQFSDKILDYLQQKYPLTLSTDVNKAVEKELHQNNNFDMLSNDFLYCNGIIFSYRESGNYNDTIMQVINKTLQIMDGPSHFSPETDTFTNFQDFQLYMSTLFEKVYKEEWMGKSLIKADKDLRTAAEHKEKYAEKVKAYTSYAIGRKISENTPHFTPLEINSNSLQIKSPAILRILTKWCEELWQKFDTQSYYSQRSEPILLQDPEYVNPFFKWMKTSIDNRMAAEKKKILEFKQSLEKHIQYQQSIILLKYLQQDKINFIPKYEKAYGMFASHMVKNLHSYIVLYLNRLIHGLLSVSKLFFEKEIDKSWEMWQSPPNLVTLKIGDLMRCKCSSRQKQIIKIYKEINSLSALNPEKMKIVRIKNRLREGTNDILINVKFNDIMVCEIQLQVNNKSKSKFIQCSNAFSHYIYQIKRSIFGPISELCNVWNNFDARSKTFKALIASQQTMVNTSQTIEVPACKQETHQFTDYSLPFQCTICNKLYFHNNHIISNRHCANCGTYKCARCQLKLLTQPELKEFLFKGKQSSSVTSLTKINETKLIDTGACIKIESTTPKIEIFRKLKVQTKNWLFGLNTRNEIYQIAKINTPKEVNEFFRQYLIFNLTLDPPKEVKVTNQQGTYFSVKEYVKESYSREKQQLILTQIRLSNAQMATLMKNQTGTQRDRKRIKKIEFASNYLTSFQFFSVFQNLTQINLDYNHISDTSALIMWKKLERLELRQNNKLQVIGKEICELQHLQQIKVNACAIHTLPQQLSMMKVLKLFNLQKNRLKTVPQQICQIKSLKDLNLKLNMLETIPSRIGELSSLRKLNISYNKITEIPLSIENLLNLTILIISNNQIKQLPAGMKNLQKLQKFQASSNSISDLDQHIFEIQSLKTLVLNNNKVQKFNCNLALCKNLTSLSLFSNSLTQISDSIGKCSNLVTLSIENNKLESLPDSLSQLQNLSKKQNLSKNKFSLWPSFLLKFVKIQQINLSFNQLTVIPKEVSKLKMLDKLNLSSNCFTEITPQFQSLSGLIQFSFKQNTLAAIPDFIADFECIKKQPSKVLQYFLKNSITQISEKIAENLGPSIVFPDNKLQNIPQGIKNKASIVLINLEKNCIRQIPSFITEFTNLGELNLRNNLIEVVPLYLSKLQKMRIAYLMLNENPIREIQCKEFVAKYGNMQTKALLNLNPNPTTQNPQPAASQDSESDSYQN